MQFRDSALWASLLAMPHVASAFYLPGVAPTTYKTGDQVPLYVNSIKPVATERDDRLHSVLSYDYYNPGFGFCKPVGGPKYVSESLGSILFGDRIMTSPFDLRMKTDEKCKVMCRTSYTDENFSFLKSKVEAMYSLNWLIDGLPAGQEALDEMDGTKFYSPGFLLGSYNGKAEPVFHNHYEILVDYHEVSGNKDNLRVVGATVLPSSKKYPGTPDCGPHEDIVLRDGEHYDVSFTYSVTWKKSDTAWATRWDKYLHVFDPKIHWFWLVDTAIFVAILVLTVMSVLVRTLKKDIARYNRLDQINLDDLSGTSALDDGVQEDSGWKLVHGDVFRAPSQTLILSVFLGNGVQLFVMTACTILFALLGFLSPSNRGSLGTIMVLLYTLLSFVGGYVSARMYKNLGGENWQINMALTPSLVPGVVFCTFFFLNLFLWFKGSSGAVPLTTMLVLIAIWFVLSIPLSVAGAFLGVRSAVIDAPVRTNQIPRQIPPCTTYLKPVPSVLIVGLLPFLAIFVELSFVMSSIWFSRIYYMFGFLFVCYALMVAVAATATILMTYFLLCSENYHWQWRSFIAAAMSGGYIFLYSLIYLFGKISVSSFSGAVLYLGYSALISFLFAILAGSFHSSLPALIIHANSVLGSIGYFASWWFVLRIYRSIKID